MKTILIRKAGKSIDVDESRFSDAVHSFVFAYGIRQVLNDSLSDMKSGAHKPDEYMNVVMDKLNALYAGDVRQKTGVDPVTAEMIRLATPAMTKKMPHNTGAEIRAAIMHWIGGGGEAVYELRAKAESNLEDLKGLVLDFDVPAPTDAE